MVRSNDIEKFDRSHRIVVYEPDGKGECVPTVTVPELAGQLVDSLYEAREQIWQRFRKELLEGRISPLRLFFEYNHMTWKDLAGRMGTSEAAVKRACEMDGFLALDVRTLQRYAAVFGVPVADFFSIVETRGKVTAAATTHFDGLFQEVAVTGEE